MPPGAKRNPAFTDQFLVDHGAAAHSTVIMTTSGYLTDEAWQQIVPFLIKGLRKVVRDHAVSVGIDGQTANKLLIGLTFDGFKSHVKNLGELVVFADKNVLAVVEGRDSSEICQPFDRFVARAGKQRAALTLDKLRRSHITPVIDQWMLVLVGLEMLRDCALLRVWENSFVAVNLHPWHRVSWEDWLPKIQPFVQSAQKFDKEIVDLHSLLPATWKNEPLEMRVKWLGIIDKDRASWDINLMQQLRDAGMRLGLLATMYKIYTVEKQIQQNGSNFVTPTAQAVRAVHTPPARKLKDKSTMLYHLFNASQNNMSPAARFDHAVAVRNRTLGPVKGVQVSPYLDVQMSADNRRFLRLKPEDVNMYRVLQVCYAIVRAFKTSAYTICYTTGGHLQNNPAAQDCQT